MVVTSPGGYPKDINLYQAQKALENVKDIVIDGGTIVLVAAYTEGFGEDTFEEWVQDAKYYEKLYKRIKKKFVLGGHKAVAASKLLIKAKVFAYSNFNCNDTSDMGFEKVDNIQDFVNERIRKDKKIKIAVVPNGRFVKYSNN